MNSIALMNNLDAMKQFSWISVSVDGLSYRVTKSGNDTYSARRLVVEGEPTQDGVIFRRDTCPFDPHKDLFEIDRKASDFGKGRKKRGKTIDNEDDSE